MQKNKMNGYMRFVDNEQKFVTQVCIIKLPTFVLNILVQTICKLDLQRLIFVIVEAEA